jgi:NAD+-dependent protein deacetylase SIR2
LPFAEAVFDISYFRNNPLPFYTLAHELYPGRYRPTITHCFTKLLYDKGLLLKLFTQNIDCLEREAGVPGEMIVEAHGSFATQRCIECKIEFPDTPMKKAVQEKEVPRCLRKTCNGLVKPDIVFFGEALPEAFHRNRTLPASADLAIVMGTSLTVQPFASLPSFVREEVPRILINLERVGGLGSRADDVLLLGACDEGVRKLADALGWLEELEELWQQTNPAKTEREEQKLLPKTRDEMLEEEVDELTKEIDKTLKLSKDQHTWLQDHLKDKHDLEQTDSAPLENTLSVTSTTSNRPEHNGPEKEQGATNGSSQETVEDTHPHSEASEAVATSGSGQQDQSGENEGKDGSDQCHDNKSDEKGGGC